MANYRVIGTDGHEYGPVSQEQVRNWIGEARVNAATLICLEGSVDWQPLGALAEFRPFVAGVPSRIPPGAPAYAPYCRTNSWAIWGFVCGLLSLTLCSCCCLPLDLMGIVFSVIGLVQINNNPQTQSGTTLAILGLVFSVLSLVMGFALSALWLSTGAGEEIFRELERGFGFGAGQPLMV